MTPRTREGDTQHGRDHDQEQKKPVEGISDPRQPGLLTGPTVLALHRTTVSELHATPKSLRLGRATSPCPSLCWLRLMLDNPRSFSLPQAMNGASQPASP
jgi:hypothetical protein